MHLITSSRRKNTMPAIFTSTLAISIVLLSTTVHGGDRRILHEPLYPIQLTPPPTIEFSDNPPAVPTSFFPDVPTTATAGASSGANTTAGASSGATAVDVSDATRAAAPRRPPATKDILIGATIFSSAAFMAILGISGFLLYRRRRARREDSGDAPATEILSLGTVEPSVRRRSGGELNSSPYRKLGTERVFKLEHHPSPELRPLPPLRGAAGSQHFLGFETPVPEVTLSAGLESDDETFYTSKRSLASAASGSPTCSPTTRRSLPGIVSGELNELSEPSVLNPQSRRLPPRMSSDGLNSQVKRMIPPAPPPPPTQTIKNITKMPPPPPRPPLFHQSVVNSDGSNRIDQTVSAQVVPLTPVEGSSRRRLLKPLPPEAIFGNRPSASQVEFSNGVDCSLKTDDEVVRKFDENVKPKLKPLHWDKVQASSDRKMVWDKFKSSSFRLNEDRIETLFVKNATNVQPQHTIRRQNFKMSRQENRVLDPKKSQNIAILLRALNVTREEVSEALQDGRLNESSNKIQILISSSKLQIVCDLRTGNPEALGAELLETLIKMAPTKEEELKFHDYTGDVSTLGSSERFLQTVLEIPYAFKRVDAMLYRANFDTEVKYLMRSFATLEAACEDLRSSKLLLKLLEAVLQTGNRMNVGTNRGQAKAFKLDTLLKLADVKGTYGKTALLHFVVQEIIRSEGAGNEVSASENLSNTIKEEQFKKQGLKVVAGLSSELGNVRKAAGMDSDVLSSYVSKLESGLLKIKSVLQLENSCTKGLKFFEVMKKFLEYAETEIGRVKAQEKSTLLLVKDITEYFHGDAAKEDLQPLRIFMVVRDFLLMLDNLCLEVGIMHERTNVEFGRSFRIAASASLPVIQRYRQQGDTDFDDDSSSS